jgi:hypothetical protein
MSRLALCVVSAGLLGVGAAAGPAPAVERKPTTTVVADKFDFEVQTGTMAVSRDGLRHAWAREVHDGWGVELDGKLQGTHEKISPFKPGSSSEALVFFPGFQPIVFSGDGQHLAYSAHDDGQWFMVHDGRKGKPYENIGGPRLSHDGTRLVYAAEKDDGWCVVTDGVEGKTYGMVGPPAISPDGRHVAYVARVGDKELVVVDGTEGKPYDRISIFPKLMSRLLNPKMVLAWARFSPDGRVAYPAKNGKSWYMVVDTQEIGPFDNVHDPAFSPDGKRCAFPAEKKDGKWSIVVDGQPQGSFDETSEQTFSSDETIRPVVFSPDGARYAGAVKVSGKWYLYTDGVLGGQAYDGVKWPVFSPDSKRLAFVAKKANQLMAVVDGVAQMPANLEVDDLVFSPDSSHVAYWLGHSAGSWMVVVDGVPAATFAGDRASRVVFDDDAHLHYKAVLKKQLLLVREELLAGAASPAGKAVQ